MLISTLEELRLYSPANAIDHFSTMAGFLDSSEHDFLLEKLGSELYAALTDYYRTLRQNDGIAQLIAQVENGDELPPYARLLTVAQRILAYDALARAIDMQAISVNGSGINISVADDYPKADRETVVAYKATCTKEAHAAVNRLLVLLEDWTQEVAIVSSSSASSENSESSENPEPSASDEKAEIAALWRSSRFFYLAASLAIPSATVLQEYLNIYDSREKFIQLLPDLRYIQEDIIAPVIGEDFMDYLVTTSQSLPTSPTKKEDILLARIIHRLRKAMARQLEARVFANKMGDARREMAHNEAIRLTTDLAEYVAAHQGDLPSAATEAFLSSPLYTPPAADTADFSPAFQNNADSSVIFVTPALN